MANNQTAVDYFFDKIKSNFEHDGDKLESVMFLYAICKEKERDQIIVARVNAPYTTGDVMLDVEEATEYYNETYKGGNK